MHKFLSLRAKQISKHGFIDSCINIYLHLIFSGGTDVYTCSLNRQADRQTDKVINCHMLAARMHTKA